MKTDPWLEIGAPIEADFSARRVDADHPFSFFWARDLEGNCLLVFEYDETVQVGDRRPKLKEIQISEPRNAGEPARFLLKLTRNDNREIFQKLCLDIVESTRICSDERSALATTIRRTWRWHGMLQGGRDERLSPEAQKGLIGELRVLEIALLPKFHSGEALDFWHGPEGAPKDFSVGTVSIEAKAKRGTARPYVEISSEYQLDLEGVTRLFLSVTYVDEAPPDAAGAQTLSDYVAQIEARVIADDSGSLGYLEARLDEAGYCSEHDYSDRCWLIGSTRWFEVTEKFPRLVGSKLTAGLKNVHYSIDLPQCSDWEVGLETVTSAVVGEA